MTSCILRRIFYNVEIVCTKMKLSSFVFSAAIAALFQVGPALGVGNCGCSSCTSAVLDKDANGYKVRDRIDWLVANTGQSEQEACSTVCGDEFLGVCGSDCNPSQCGVTDIPTKNPTPKPVTGSPTKKRCGCSSCTTSVLGRDAGGVSVGNRIDWVMDNMGRSEEDACDLVCGVEYPDVCEECDCDGGGGGGDLSCAGCSWDDGNTCPDWWCNENQSNCNVCTGKWFGGDGDDGDNGDDGAEQKCGGAVDSTNDGTACQSFLWGPTGDSSMPCFSYGGSGDQCSLNNNNDENDGLFKNPSLCLGNVFYLWDEPDTQGKDYSWAGVSWLDYSRRFAKELGEMRSRGTKVTGPLLKAGNSGVIEQNMKTFFNACGQACFDPADPAYIDVIGVNAFCGPWNDASGGCRSGASFIYDEAVSVSSAFNNLPVYITNWSRLQSTNSADQVDAINSIDQFFPSGGVVKRVYWFGAKDFGGGSETSSYLTNVLPDGRTLGEVWRAKCDSL